MGAVIYEATTGLQPFASSGDLEVMTKIVDGRLTPPSAHVRGYPRELEAIVMQAMATKPDNRFPSADEMRLALEGFMSRTGPPVTHADVGALLRSRVGPKMDERLERIRAAMSAIRENHPSHTPSTSGVIPTNRVPARIAPPPPGIPHEANRGAPLPKLHEQPDQGDFDSGFNMDTVADFQLPEFLDPGSARVGPAPLPAAGAAPAPTRAPFPAPGQPPAQVDHREPGPVSAEPAVELKQYILAAALGVLIAVVLGGGAYAAFHFLGPGR